MSTNLPIASLDPSAAPPPQSSISGIITLLWPYSSSTRTFAFLLSDPDFRLRSRKGQVRVRFTGASAKAVAESHVGIGDAVRVALAGASWGEDRESARTPGKSVEGELCFGRRVGLRVWRGGRAEGDGEGLEVDAAVSPPASVERRETVGEDGYNAHFTPAPRASNGMLRRSLDGSTVGDGWTYSSPAFAKRLRLSGDDSFTGSDFDPFVDGEVERNGKRTSFGTGLRWRYLERTPSPVKEQQKDLGGAVVRVVQEESPSRAVKGTESAKREQETASQDDGALPVEDEESEDDVVEVAAPARPAVPIASPQEGPISSAQAVPETMSTPKTPNNAPQRAMPPPSIPLPRLRMPSEEQDEGSQQPAGPISADEGPSTPKLEPLKSPTLPLPSPFPADAVPPFSTASQAPPRPYAANSLFGALGNAASVIESRRLSGRGAQSQLHTAKAPSLPPAKHTIQETPTVAVEEAPKEKPTASTIPAQDEIAAPIQPSASVSATKTVDLTDDDRGQAAYDEDDEMLEEPAQGLETDVNQSLSTTILDDDMYDEYQKKMMTPAEVADEIAGRDETTVDKELSEQITADLVQDREEVDEDDEIEVVEAAMSRDRGSSPQKPPPSAFGLDGATPATPHALPQLPALPKPSSETAAETLRAAELKSRPQLATPLKQDQSLSATSSVQTTPRSEKERVRKNTYRSLFGLRSPEAEGQSVVPSVIDRQEERYIPGWFFEVGQQQDDRDATGTKGRDVSAGPLSLVKTDQEVRNDTMEAPQSPKPEVLDTISVEAAPQHAQEPKSSTRSSRTEVIELDVSSDVEAAVDEDSRTTQKVSPAPQSSKEEHIAPPRSSAAKRAEHGEPSSEPGDFPSSPITRFRPQRLGRDEAHRSDKTPSHPSLPLSPSNSQSLQDMEAQPAIGEPVRGKLPLTPQLTQRESSVREEEHTSQKTPAPKLLRNDSSLRAEDKSAESPVKPQTKTPSRRSVRLRKSEVPDVLSEWFSPRSFGIVHESAKAVERTAEPAFATSTVSGVETVATNGHAVSGEVTAPLVGASGFATAYSYFSPLSQLSTLLNPSSQNGSGTNTIDVLAVVTDKSKEPARAKSGPRDYFTIFHITDTSLSLPESTRVEVFRPYKNTLPVAEVGDVVLLRAFAVKSKRRTPHLLSTDSSAWCVWRYPDDGNEGRPAWAKKGRAGSVVEEVKGPPVEFGQEEREHARKLKEWWAASQRDRDVVIDEAPVKSSAVKEEVPAKL